MAFNCPVGCCQFQVMLFRLHGDLDVFMQLINVLLHEHLYKGVLVFLDNILFFTEMMEEHVKLVRVVLKKLKRRSFHRTRVDYLGYWIL